MQQTGNTILITGGGSGIGRGLAEAFHAQGNRVIIAGRRRDKLDAAMAANPGISAYTLDIEDASAIRAFATQLIAEQPTLNVLINNAGIMRLEVMPQQGVAPQGLDDATAMITTNLLGPIRLTTALLPHLQKQSHAAIINVSSGLAFVPLTITPTYSATKAALHSHTQSLRAQLRGSAIQVIELIPPAVATELMPDNATNPHAMPLRAFIDESMALLRTQPDAVEICVERVKFLRYAERDGKYDSVFQMLNQPRAGA
jgi:uncharacterized oxidoreductase